jgi:hypothetical protein
VAPLFDAPSTPPAPLAAKKAYSQIGSCACKQYTHGNWSGLECNVGRCFQTNVSHFDFMGYTALSPEGWRYTLWAHMDNATQRVDFSRPTFDELYDLRGDAHSDFDSDAYSENLASANGPLCATFKEEMIAAVQSWY